MDINYKIENCPHCNSNNIVVKGNEKECYGLVNIKENNVADYNTFLPVIAVVCKDCGHVELVHINCKKIA